MAEERIGRYRILEEIASGTQGTVYRAFDPDSGGLVALKVLHPSLTGDPSYLERFQREASLAASIDHPNVVRIFEVGEADGRHFMALEFLPENVARLMESGGLQKKLFQRSMVKRPSSRKRLPSAAMAGWAPL